MWWRSAGVAPGGVRFAAVLVAALVLGACNVRPLYGPVAVGGDGLTSTLANVDVAPVEGRPGQQVRNDLLFLLNGGDPGGADYVVKLQVDEKYTNVITRAISGLPGGRNIRLTVKYELRKPGDDAVLTSGVVTRISSFDYFNQRFANDRATIDAENRAAREAAADIHLRLSSFFVTGKSYDSKGSPTPGIEEDIPNFGDSIFSQDVDSYGSPL